MGTAKFVIADYEKCTGCRSCELACFAAHENTGKRPRTVAGIAAPVVPNLFLARVENKVCMPIQCHHCEDAPCVKACVPGALKKDADGHVLINKKRCIGCKSCVLACPFGAVQVIEGEPAIAHKCDFCADVPAGAGQGDPMCVAACPEKALRVVDVADETAAKRVETVAVLNALYEGGK
jgi:electron transport protein HydN